MERRTLAASAKSSGGTVVPSTPQGKPTGTDRTAALLSSSPAMVAPLVEPAAKRKKKKVAA